MKFLSPAECVGSYIEHVFSRLKLPTRVFKRLYHSVAVIHECHGYNLEQIIIYLFTLYQRVPEFYEIFSCTYFTTKDDIELFFQRIENFPRHYVILQVNELSSSLQEVVKILKLLNIIVLNYFLVAFEIVHGNI